MANRSLLLMLALVLFMCSTIPACLSAIKALYESDLFCCIKDKLCWPSLQECMPNCPCKVNCGGKKKNQEAPEHPSPVVVRG
ncbi:hypothetical protein PVAP13_6KG053900 [Panicum virgatum]|uniref:Uncharacterized protein n=1 Tax=Panicum virgatum TaxID=38727 RepID=A0A8T0R738_PANVG|nr:hypothetical protein PVAP13_6KG053900 [Panicum virgatum]